MIRNSAGETLFSSGVASQPEVTRALIAAWPAYARQQAPQVTMLAAGERQFTVVSFRSEGSIAALLFESGDDDAVVELAAGVDFAEDVLRHFLNDPYEAFVLVDRQGKVRFISEVHKRFFGLDKAASLGKHVTEVLENTRLHEVAQSGRAEIGHVQTIRGTRRVVVRKPIFSREGKVVGAIGQLMFHTPEHLRALSDEVGRLRSEVDFYKRELSGLRNRTFGLDQIVGSSPAIRRLKEDIVKVAGLDVPVLVVGESGTGKELVAHAIHLLSARSDKPMVTVNAAAMPATLVESELFGYEPGAFTGAAKSARKGKFEQADGGTLFFDEIGDMPLETQVKLLRVLQDGSFERLGGAREHRSDFRFISASNRNFESMIEAGTFRLDLFYRISAVTLKLPALRERPEDIPPLVEVALAGFAARHGVARKKISAEALASLVARPWPGNVRQLLHAVERAAIFTESEVIGADDFGAAEQLAPADAHVLPSSMRSARDQVEEQLIRRTMERLHGNKKRAAAELGVSRSHLYKRLADLGIQ